MPNVMDFPTKAQPPDPRQQTVGAAAYALAEINGEDWGRMTAVRFLEYCELAELAARLANPDSRLDMAYVIEADRILAEHGPSRLADLTPLERRQRALRTSMGLKRAARAAAGTDPDSLTTAKLQAGWDESDKRQTGAIL